LKLPNGGDHPLIKLPNGGLKLPNGGDHPLIKLPNGGLKLPNGGSIHRNKLTLLTVGIFIYYPSEKPTKDEDNEAI
ncbi:hypothetical protein, partial [Vibrio parahaemolyticus]|uniref:hypothetical protein n=1 Tax=Vibrio parahaemolyticus TaxID=670 RepID=UPI0025557EE8